MTEAGSGRPRQRRPVERAAFSGKPPGDDRPGLGVRMAAARLLAAVIETHTPLDGLVDHDHGHPQFRALDMRDRALVRAILSAALRHRRGIETLVAARLKSPLPAKATTLAHILHVGAAQILFLDIPDSAAVDLAVAHAKSDPRTLRFAGLVNAVLRAIARDKEAGTARAPEVADAPDWFIERLRAAYGAERAAAILAAHGSEAPTDFSVKSDPDRWADALGGLVLPTGSVRVAKPGSVPELPGFAEGAWWVQDAAATLPARLFGTLKGLNVADLCAAPGGKTAQLAVAGARVTAVDASANRIVRLEQNLTRLGLSASIVRADLLAWQPADLFDAVLLDAPCSSTGTVRRHPDIAWTKTPADIDTLAALQRRLLDRAVGFVKPGGRLVFSNCSLDPREGELLVDAFLRDTQGVAADPISPDELAGIAGFVTAQGWLRTTPADMAFGDPAISGMDGFFAARFRRL